jgi:hypothetical protein
MEKEFKEINVEDERWYSFVVNVYCTIDARTYFAQHGFDSDQFTTFLEKTAKFISYNSPFKVRYHHFRFVTLTNMWTIGTA